MGSQFIMTATTQFVVQVEFQGGLELLFSNVKQYCLTWPVDDTVTTAVGNESVTTGPCIDSPATVGLLIVWLRDHLLRERVDLFAIGNKLYVCTCSISIPFHLLKASSWS